MGCSCNIDNGHGYTCLPIWSAMFNVHKPPSAKFNQQYNIASRPT